MSAVSARLLRAQDHIRMPWRNGGGVTGEVAREPAPGLDFGWRLSIAEVARDGGFSSFAGCQRIIAVLEGQGMQLTVDGQAQPVLGPGAPYAFSGDARVECRLPGGPIRDFNLIYRPERYSVRLQWLAGRAFGAFHSAASTVLLFNAGAGPLRLLRDGVAHVAPGRHDCLRLDGPAALAAYEIEAPSGLDACLVEIAPR